MLCIQTFLKFFGIKILSVIMRLLPSFFCVAKLCKDFMDLCVHFPFLLCIQAYKTFLFFCRVKQKWYQRIVFFFGFLMDGIVLRFFSLKFILHLLFYSWVVEATINLSLCWSNLHIFLASLGVLLFFFFNFPVAFPVNNFDRGVLFAFLFLNVV